MKNYINHLALPLLATFLLTSCSKQHGEREILPTGAVPPESVRAGIPESVFSNGILSYTKDTSAAASVNGKTQYLSRSSDIRGARLVVQCVNKQCIMVQAYLLDNPVPKEQAIELLKSLMPASAEPLSKVDFGQLTSNGHTQKAEIYEYGTDNSGSLVYTEKNDNLVSMVNASTLKPSEMASWFSITLKAPVAAKPAVASKH